MRTLLVFILFSSTMCWVMFSPAYKHVLIVRQALLQKEVDYLLEMGASGQYGYVDDAMIADSKTRLEQHGLDPTLLDYEIVSSDGLNAMDMNQPIERGSGIIVTIRYPTTDLYMIDRLVGIDLSATQPIINVSGIKMSEYVP